MDKALILPKAVIFGCSGTVLTETERDFFKRTNPLGFILFARNCESPAQLTQLVKDLKSTLSHSFPVILIDQEGGRVVRLKPPHWRAVPRASLFGDLAETFPELAAQSAFDNSFLIGQELADLGINVDCAPCADLLFPEAHDIIGDRSFGDQPHRVAMLSLKVIEGLYACGVIPVIKHLPGHGRAQEDSHETLPIISVPFETLARTDFLAFQKICEALPAEQPMPWGMTAHVVYTAIDDQVATYSTKVIHDTIRNHIGFKGFLLSDDLCMKALKDPFTERAAKALVAGCDAVLHCSGHLDEMIHVAGGVDLLCPVSVKRLIASWPFTAPLPVDSKQLTQMREGIERLTCGANDFSKKEKVTH